MTTSRRGFLGSLLALPVVARLWPWKAKKTELQLLREYIE